MDYGVERIYHPHDGMEMGLEEMIRDLVASALKSERKATSPSNNQASMPTRWMIAASPQPCQQLKKGCIATMRILAGIAVKSGK